jgi:hypothetical protein
MFTKTVAIQYLGETWVANGLLPFQEGIEKPLKLLPEGIELPLKAFARGSSHKHAKGQPICNTFKELAT